MAIKFTKRANITNDFKFQMLKLSQDKLAALHTEYEALDTYFKKNFIKKNGILIATLRNFVSDTGKQDKVWAQFRMLSFESFDIETWDRFTYLRGTTTTIINEGLDNIGQYSIYINIEDYIKGDTKDIHFVSESEPLNGFRFWHHFAKGPRYPLMDGSGYPNHGQEDKSMTLTHRLDAQPFTCWGTFGSAATMQFAEMNTPELFRNLHIYLTRHAGDDHLWPRNFYTYFPVFRMPWAVAV